MEPLIRNISDTALWAAMFRARENDRADALFRDPMARRLAGERGERIANNVEYATENEWAWIMRTWLYDRIIRQQVERGASLVINLAAGLDARPYRMDLPPSLQWVEVDLPDLLDYKQAVLADEKPACGLERVALDLSDLAARRDFLGKLAERGRQALVITEGLLIYLTNEQVGSLARDLSATPGVNSWVLDISSPALRDFLKDRMGKFTEGAGAPLLFAPEEGPQFFAQYGWNPLESNSILQAAFETSRVPKELLQAPPPRPPGGGEFWSGVCLLGR